VYFFNTEDIDIVWFKGYVDESEEVKSYNEKGRDGKE